MVELDKFEQDLFASTFEGERWTYVPRPAREGYGLAIVVVGHSGKLDVPLEACRAASFGAIKAHAEALNRRRSAAQPA